MLIYDIKSAIRSILRNKVPSLISVLGLGIGLGCIIILLALIIHEKSFDTFIPGSRSVYRIVFGNSGQTYYPVAETMANEFPEVKDFFRYYQTFSILIKTPGDEMIREEDFGFADSSAFRILGVKFLYGTYAKSVGEVAVSEEAAKKFFGNLTPVGEVILVRLPDGYTPLTVSGVYRNLPPNSTLKPSFITDIRLSGKIFRQFQRTLGDYAFEDEQPLGWRNPEFLSYLVLDKNADPEELSAKMGKYKELIPNPGKDTLSFKLQPVTDIYLGSGDIAGSPYLRRGNAEELRYYEIISLLILLISVANFVLLARAGVSEKIRELGTRKVYGASQGKIKRLILLESVVTVLLSLIPAFFVIDFGMPFINTTLNKTLTGQVFLIPQLWFLLIIVVFLTGIFSGWVIGMNYSQIPALKLLSGKITGLYRSNRWNYSFLILHFTIYVMLVSGMIMVSKQIDYSMTGYTGINVDNVLVTELNSDELKKSFLTLCDEMKKVPGVTMAAGGSYIPPFNFFLPVALAVAGGEKVRFDGLIMGEGMTELLNIEVIDGSSFGPYKSGTPEILVNESTAKKYNVKAGDNLLVFRVRGVVRDFHAHSLHRPIQPMVILPQNPDKMQLLAVRTDGRNDESVKKRLKEIYSQISPDEIFEVSYLAEEIENFYTSEKNQFRIICAFSLLAMVLSVMGLFGISLISISKRKKEIGIRKVAGSTVQEILLLLNTDFLKWILVAIILAVPASVWLLSLWLNRFAYKTEMSWWIFGIAGISAILIAVLTVSWQSWRAATRNPVEALRYE